LATLTKHQDQRVASLQSATEKQRKKWEAKAQASQTHASTEARPTRRKGLPGPGGGTAPPIFALKHPSDSAIPVLSSKETAYDSKLKGMSLAKPYILTSTTCAQDFMSSACRVQMMVFKAGAPTTQVLKDCGRVESR
jgi:hypothetical protein